MSENYIYKITKDSLVLELFIFTLSLIFSDMFGLIYQNTLFTIGIVLIIASSSSPACKDNITVGNKYMYGFNDTLNLQDNLIESKPTERKYFWEKYYYENSLTSPIPMLIVGFITVILSYYIH
ncbi:hypothetical protein [Clostridium sp.]|uniref:hypothetical protein n=1 Tax=Clostridium sp. TaxID=1506 RepID=UPI001B3F92C7|nr:hypothetical protein [Clostridium sp.]MBP3914978.1 hypothetical protein [Clostridium sp.]